MKELGHLTPDQAAEWAKKVCDLIPDATIFGGFWRDVLHDKPVKDIDVAIGARHLDLHEKGFKPIETEAFGDYDHDMIDQVWNHTEMPINLIEYCAPTTAKAMNDYVDIGLCAVAFSEREGLVRSPRYDFDSRHKLLTVSDRGWGRAGVEEHLARLVIKYPDFRVNRA